MSARLLKNLKYSAAYSILIYMFIVTSAAAVQAEALYLPRSTEATVPVPANSLRTIQQKMLLKLDEKGDLLIQCGCARFVVAYNTPADQFKASEQQYNPQNERSATINGFSLTASLSF